MRAVLKTQINKTDRNDARGMAQMMRVGLYRPVHVKTLRSQKLRMLLTHRKLLQSKAIAIDNDLRGTLRNFGLKVCVETYHRHRRLLRARRERPRSSCASKEPQELPSPHVMPRVTARGCIVAVRSLGLEGLWWIAATAKR
jgi:transposase